MEEERDLLYSDAKSKLYIQPVQDLFVLEL